MIIPVVVAKLGLPVYTDLLFFIISVVSNVIPHKIQLKQHMIFFVTSHMHD